MTSSDSPTVAAQRGDIMVVRALLDDALLGLRAIGDAEVRVRDAERDIAAALLHVYRALATPGDAAAFDGESTSALSRRVGRANGPRRSSGRLRGRPDDT